MARQAVADKRQRRERGSISVDEIINGAFDVAGEVSVDGLSMPLLAKHLDVGVTSIYWYFRKKDDLLNAMTDRALGQYDFATPFVEGQDWRDSLRDHAHKMRQTFRDNPILCDLILIRGTFGREATLAAFEKLEKAIAALVEAGLSPEDAFDTYASISVHTQGAAVLERLQDKSDGAETYRRSGSSVIDPETMPLIARLTQKGHRIGVADDINFEYGLTCILDHASRLIDARKVTLQSPSTPGRDAAVTPAVWLDLDHYGAALAAARAHRRDTDSASATAQFVHQRGQHPGAAGGDRVAQAAAAAVDVDQLFVEPVFAARRDRHRRERLVDLPQRDVAGRQSGAVEHLADHLHRAQTGVPRLDGGRGPRLDRAQHLQPVSRGEVLVGQRQRSGRVVGAAAVALR